jgi:membrane-associated phospholipid phosphatase
LIILIISFYWKISGHMLLDAISYLTLILINPMFILTLPFFILVGYTRVALKKHSISQVIVGFLIGLTLAYLISVSI